MTTPTGRGSASRIASLQEHLVVPVDDTLGRRAQLVYAPTEYVRIVPFARSPLRLALYGLLLLCSGGLLLIVSVWFPQIFTNIARRRLPYSCVGDADYMLVLVHEDGFRSKWIEVPVHRPVKVPSSSAAAATKQRLSTVSNGQPVMTPSEERTKLPWIWFEFKRHRYVFNHEKGEFERYLATVKEELEKIRSRVDTGLDAFVANTKMELFGPNVVDIDPPFIPMLLFTKVVHPYYLFQYFSAIVWMAQDYTVYAIVILALSVISLTWEIYSEVSNNKRLRELVRSDYKVQVFRAGAASESKMITLHETDLVPGDIVELTTGPVVADVLLLSGGCVVDEAALTGEAVPINKEPARGRATITEAEARVQLKSSFLHAGSTVTRIRDASGPCKGVVLSTGFSTGKGELFRSIIFPRHISFEFERDSYRYLAVLATIALTAFAKRLYDFGSEGYGFGYTFVNSLDLVTIAVPPALPLVLSSGIGFALERLERAGIFCIDSKRINSCGQLTCFCFDKTGTLTEEHLHLTGVDVVDEASQTLQYVGFDVPEMFRLAMATCHGLSEVDGKMQGYSLELSMFDTAKMTLEFVHDRAKSQQYLAIATTPAGDQYGVVKRFPFDPACQRSSVVVEHLVTKQRVVFVKGSPEAVRDVAVRTPNDFNQRALRYAAEGNYCIAFGMRMVAVGEPLNLDARDSVDANTTFMGIALFHNDLKPESKGMLAELYGADIDVRMITGDNALTAVHVARLLDMPLRSKVAIVDVDDASGETVFHCVEAIRMAESVQWEPFTAANAADVMATYELALTGAALEQLKSNVSDETMDKLVVSTQIFARIRPQQKAWIVERLMDSGRVVGMCGDGTNDCGALKAAHVGLALSSAEASIVAPFTSKAKAVTDVPALIREGRCALMTSFLGFKYMVLYPIIQLGMASTLGHINTMLSNNQYLWDDLAIVLGLAITMLYTASSKKLSRERPANTLFSLSIVLSIVGQVVLFVAFFAGMYSLLLHQPWVCRRHDGMTLVEAYLNDTTTAAASLPADTYEKCKFYIKYVDQVKEEVHDIKHAHEDAAIWLFGHLQYFVVAAVFNLRDPFRLPCYTNKLFVAFFGLSLGVNLWFLLDTSNVIESSLDTVALPGDFRLKLLWLLFGHMAAATLWELFSTRVVPRWRGLRPSSKELQDKPDSKPPSTAGTASQGDVSVTC
ncbi:hypothetical protein ATCC90586_003864 [Pythium insidiosum]|nr:hypothetical protein ATCC90586_003864 [Pythium insidiosum]